MGKLAGYWKKIKHTVQNVASKALDSVGTVLQNLSQTKILHAIPGGLGKPLNRVIEKAGTTLSKFSDAIDGEISGTQLWDYINDEYRHASVLGPINEARMMYDSVKDAHNNGDGILTGLWNGAKNVVSDVWNYTKEFLE